MPLSSIGKIWAYTSEKITEIFGLMVQRLDDVIAGGGLGVGGGRLSYEEGGKVCLLG